VGLPPAPEPEILDLHAHLDAHAVSCVHLDQIRLEAAPIDLEGGVERERVGSELAHLV
jgi:hypothetical protein